MCDLFAAIGVKNGAKLRKFMKEAAPKLKGHRNKHGIGYTAMTKTGEIFGERWLDPDKAFNGKPTTKADEDLVNELAPLMKEVPDLNCYNSFGTQRWKDVCATIYHARFATCTEGMDNVHPFVTKDGLTSLVHNGVIKNADELENITSTCDSEGVMNKYLELGINLAPQDINSLYEALDGAFTVMVTSVDEEGERFIDIFKESQRTLYLTKVDELGGYIFTSNKDVVIDTCKKLNWEQKNLIHEVDHNTFCRFNPITGKLIGDILSCTPRESNRGNSTKENSNSTWKGKSGYWHLGEFIEYEDEDYSGYENNTPDTKKESDSDTTKKDRTIATQRNNRAVLQKLLENRKSTGSIVGHIVKSGVCTVAQFLANETNLFDTILDSDTEEDNGTTKKDVVVSSTDGKPVGNTSKGKTLPMIYEGSEADMEYEPVESNLVEEFMPDLEASDTKYGAAYQEMDETEIDVLESYAIILDKLEQDAINELPEDIKYVYLKNRYEKNVGKL